MKEFACCCDSATITSRCKMFEKTFRFTISLLEKRFSLFTMPVFFAAMALLGVPYYLFGHYKEDTSGDLSLMFQVPMIACFCVGLVAISVGVLTGNLVLIPFVFYFGLLALGKFSNIGIIG